MAQKVPFIVAELGADVDSPLTGTRTTRCR
jgi:hypothetical protein